jgi:hypothetical protein
MNRHDGIDLTMVCGEADAGGNWKRPVDDQVLLPNTALPRCELVAGLSARAGAIAGLSSSSVGALRALARGSADPPVMRATAGTVEPWRNCL